MNNINYISEFDSFTQYSQISGVNDNHFYQEINYQPNYNEVKSNKVVVIEDIEGDLFFNQKLFLDASGMKNGLRAKKDGFTFFGSITHYHGKVINDFVLNLKEDLVNNLKAKIYFAIFFDRTLNTFFFKNVKKVDYNNIPKIDFQCVIFSKESKKCELYNKNIFQIGNNVNYLFIEILNDSSIKVDILTKGKINNVEGSFCFGISDSPVTIGTEGKIVLQRKREPTVIYYMKEEKKWYLLEKKDDVWMACDKKIEIGNKRLFKMDKDIFEISCDE